MIGPVIQWGSHMKRVQVGIVTLISFVIFGCGGGYWWSDYSAKITLVDETVLECSNGFWIANSYTDNFTRCYKTHGYEDVKNEAITQIMVTKKSKQGPN